MPDFKNSIGLIFIEGATVDPNAKIIAKSKSGRPIIESVMQTGEEENRNGRTYLTGDLMREVTCPRTLELIRTGNMKCENGHPMDQSMIRQQTIDPNNTVAKILEFRMEGNDVVSILKGTNNELGKCFDEDLLDGELPSWSLRALGSLENLRGRNVVRNLKMITYDRVIYPSHPGAYTRKILDGYGTNEAKEFARFHNAVNENGLIVPITNQDVISYIKTESANVSSILNQFDTLYESCKLVDPRHVQLVGRNGDVFMINLESHIINEIQNYCING